MYTPHMKTDNSKLIEVNKTASGSKVQACATSAAAPSNGRGTATPQFSKALLEPDSPRLVIRGESLRTETPLDEGESYELVSRGGKAALISTPIPSQDTEPFAAITDYLNCTFPFNSSDLPFVLNDLFNLLGSNFSPAIDRGKGLHGYQQSFKLGISTAFFAYGGQRGTAFISLPSGACGLVQDWPEFVNLMRDKYGARITRWDGAVDDYQGAHSVDYAVQLYRDGLFSNGGNKPKCRESGSWLEPDGSGRTLYIGKRENGKMLRVYEKGMQLGAKWHPWVRWEVELHNVDRFIPWEVLLEPGKYVAGSYPKALNWVQDEMLRIRTIQKTVEIGYDYLTHYASVAYGKLISVMLEVEGTPEKVLAKLVREGIPKRMDVLCIPDKAGA